MNGVNAGTGTLSSPSANQAAANLKAGAKVLVCQVASVASLTKQIKARSLGSQALIEDTTGVYVVTADVCAALGGSVVPGPVIVPASAMGVGAE